ncbi:MAG TPA: ion transporter [candidate division Zixibacteria bacterium]|nr:ion transporter [candidate division Zixibacteria bacterium]
MVKNSRSEELKSTGYELFILLLSLVSIFNLAVDVLGGFLDVYSKTLEVIAIINGILTFFFLFDFLYRLFTAASKTDYFFRNWGWSDLLACIPTFRIFRVFRVFRAVRLLRQFGPKNMLKEVSENRAGSALYIALFGIIIVMQTAAIAVLRAESANIEANITSAGDAVWWVLATLTTVGYGDFYPITLTGRIAATFVMFAGVALIGVLASYLANFFLEPPQKQETIYESTDPRSKLVELRFLLAQQQTAQQALESKIAELEEIL